MIETGLMQLLSVDPGIAGLAQGRITWLQMDREADAGGARYPACTLQIVGGMMPVAFDGLATGRIRLQVDSWALRYLDAATLRATIRSFFLALEPCELADGTYLQLAEWIQPLDYWDENADSYRCSDEFYLHMTSADADLQENTNG